VNTFPLSQRFDIAALKKGASVTALFAVPPTLIARFFLDDKSYVTSWSVFLSLLSIFGFILGSGVAAWHQSEGRPMLHAMTAGVGVFIVIQSLFLVVRVLLNGDIRIGRIATSLALALFASVIGGALGSFLQHSGAKPR